MRAPVAPNTYACRNGEREERSEYVCVCVCAHPGPEDHCVAMVTSTIIAHEAEASGSKQVWWSELNIYLSIYQYIIVIVWNKDCEKNDLWRRWRICLPSHGRTNRVSQPVNAILFLYRWSPPDLGCRKYSSVVLWRQSSTLPESVCQRQSPMVLIEKLNSPVNRKK